ncbi:STAS domain-containing protein [Desulfopila sp. IMCC35008]|uniref:STAS domain-containing protein n=1 Tax=Desulfopila sp. IMCC35008 TaxID=2653858 RepID=UPI0013D8DEED|nr:STAS domain-containing protein [Desulfopila sp. IMCC35008]
MDLEYEKREDGTLVQVIGRMDAISAPAFEKGCTSVIDDGEKRIVVDCTRLEYISSAGLRSILVAAKKMKGSGGTISFCGLAGMVEEVFKVSGMGSMFVVTNTAEEAFGS